MKTGWKFYALLNKLQWIGATCEQMYITFPCRDVRFRPLLWGVEGGRWWTLALLMRSAVYGNKLFCALWGFWFWRSSAQRGSWQSRVGGVLYHPSHPLEASLTGDWRCSCWYARGKVEEKQPRGGGRSCADGPCLRDVLPSSPASSC